MKEKIVLANNIKYYREKQGLTQYQLAKKVGLTRRGIMAIENKQLDLRMSNALKISNVLNVRIDLLFKLK